MKTEILSENNPAIGTNHGSSANAKKETRKPFEKVGRLSLEQIKEIASNYKRIGTDYYLYHDIYTAKRNPVKVLKKWRKTTIKDDHGPKVLEQIEKYYDFVLVPDNTVNFQRNIMGCYNIYEPMQHLPKEGDFKKVMTFLEHIFGSYLEIGLDYLTLLYTKPAENLPALCLVSKEQKTGKTTFLKWLQKIYGDNAVILGNEDFGSNFNTAWVSKLVIGIDESFIEKRIIKEKIKRLVTDDSILVENKGVDKVRRNFIGKFVLLSNNEDNFIQMEKEDNRFFVLKIPTVRDENPNILDELTAEIPAFLHFLKTREMYHKKKESRLWFKPELYITDVFRRVVKNTKTVIEKSIIEYLAELADNIRAVDDSMEVNSIDIVPARIAEAIRPMATGINGLNIKIGDILKKEWDLSPTEKSERFSYPFFDFIITNSQTNEKERVVRFNSQTGKFYKIPFSLIDEKGG